MRKTKAEVKYYEDFTKALSAAKSRAKSTGTSKFIYTASQGSMYYITSEPWRKHTPLIKAIWKIYPDGSVAAINR